MLPTVTAHLSPDEAQALLAAVRPSGQGGTPAAVETRDFGRPQRLSARASEELRKRVQGALRECEQALGRALRTDITLELAELGEVNAQGLFDELVEPFALARFDVGGQPAWARWDIAGAVSAIERKLGMQTSAAKERALSALERRFLVELFEGVVAPLVKALNAKASNVRIVAEAENAGAWSEGGPGADRARLRLHLVCNGLGAPSGIDLWLPGVAAREPAQEPAPQSLPRHLDDVSVWISARLGARDVPLAELLAIEAGDVIPLGTSADGGIEVLAEDVPCARARLGRSEGRIALRIEEVGPPPHATA